MQYAILQSNSPRLVGRVPVCACFSATCVYYECQKVLLSPSLVSSDRLRSIEKASPLYISPLWSLDPLGALVPEGSQEGGVRRGL